MEEKTYTKEQLIKAMQQYNSDALSNPTDYDPITTSLECAEWQVNYLLSLITE